MSWTQRHDGFGEYRADAYFSNGLVIQDGKHALHFTLGEDTQQAIGESDITLDEAESMTLGFYISGITIDAEFVDEAIEMGRCEAYPPRPLSII